MPWLTQHTFATKVVGVSGAQTALRLLREAPSLLQFFDVDELGVVRVKFMRGPIIKLGWLKPDYLDAASAGARVVRWEVTGGEPSGIVDNGLELLRNYGLNLQLTTYSAPQGGEVPEDAAEGTVAQGA